jgi:hypothetical protein
MPFLLVYACFLYIRALFQSKVVAHYDKEVSVARGTFQAKLRIS